MAKKLNKAAPKTAPEVKTSTIEPKKQDGQISTSFIFVLLVAFSFAFIAVYIYVFDKKIDLSGDSLSYYFLGKNLFKGLGYANNISGTISPENHFPPGYPFLISVIMLLGLKSYIAVKIANGLFFFGSLILSFMVIRKLTDDWKIPLVTMLFTALNSFFLYFSFITMSEIPFMFFCMFAIFILLHVNEDHPLKDWKFYMLIPVIILIYYIRTAGLAIIFSSVIFFLLRKNWIPAAIMLVSFVLGALPWYLRNKAMGGNVYIKVLFYKEVYNPELGFIDFGGFLQRIWENLVKYITTEIQNGLFSFLNRQKPTDDTETYGLDVWIVGLVIIAFIVYALIKQKKFQGFLFWYLAASGGIALIWPQVWTDLRFIMPIIPIISFLFFKGAVELVDLILSKLNLNFKMNVLVFLILILPMFPKLKELHASAKADYMPEWRNYIKMAQYCKENISPTDMVVCRKPPIFHFFSEGATMNQILTNDDKEMLKRFKQANVKYVILDQLGFTSTSKFLYPAIQKNPEKFPIVLSLPDPTKEDSFTYLLEFKP